MGGELHRIVLFAVLLAAALVMTPAAALGLDQDAYEPDDFPELARTLGTNQPTAQDRTLQGFDRDLVRVEVQAGVSYEFVVLSRPGRIPANVSMTLWPAELATGGETWSLANVTTVPGADSTRLIYTPTETGDLYLAVDSRDFDVTASYWLVAYTGQDLRDEYELYDLSPLPGTGYMCDDPPLQRSLMPPDDVDWFNVFAPSPGEYQLRTGFSALGTPPDTVLEVWDASGTQLLASNDNGDDGGPLSSVNVVASEATSWRVRVSAAGDPMIGAYSFSAIAVPRSMGRVYGAVAGPTGEAAGGARIELLAMDYSVLRTTYSAADGTYSFEDVPRDVAFRVRADIEGAGLVPDLFPQTRHLANPEDVPGCTLSSEIPDLHLNLQIQNPWVSGWVYEDSSPYSALPGMSVTAYDLAGAIIGTGTTAGNGTYRIDLPPFTTGACKVEVRDPSGLHRTTWWWNSPDADSAPEASIPTFGGLSVLMPRVSRPQDVLFDLGDVSITFDEVTSPGDVTATPTSPQNLPATGFRMVTGRHYNIHPTVGFSGGATIKIAIPAEEAENATSMRLFHWEGGRWVDITTSVNAADMTVTGRTATFSDFSLQTSSDASLEATAMTPGIRIGVLLVVASALMVASRRHAGSKGRR